MPETTTVKVPVPLRDRIAARARTRQVSQAEVVAEALDALDRGDFWESIAYGYTRLRRDSRAWKRYVSERDSWLSAALGDDDE